MLFYVRGDDGQLIEFEIGIPEGYILFFNGHVMHCGASYRDEVPAGMERIFCYVLGYGPQYEVIACEDLTKEEMCAQQGVDPALYELHTPEKVNPSKRIRVHAHSNALQ